MRRKAVTLLVVCSALPLGYLTGKATSAPLTPPTPAPVVSKAQYDRVAHQLLQERKESRQRIKSLTRQLRMRYKADALEAIRFGSIVTGYPYSQGVALVRCETGGTFSPYARNSTPLSGSNATGLWQFLYHPQGIRSSTWHQESRYGSFNIYNPYIQSVAAGEHWKKYGRSWYKGWLDICGRIADGS